MGKAEVIRFTRRGSARASSPGGLVDTRDDGRFEGYASLFGRADAGGDVVAQGAFVRSLKARGARGVKMLYQHSAAEPIGVWSELYEDPVGLFVRGRVLTDISRGRDVLALMREGALDGLSIGFKTIRARMDRLNGRRTILEADLWEVSVVTFPMLTGARVTRVA
jgi:HK97 family phage prohead protease